MHPEQIFIDSVLKREFHSFLGAEPLVAAVQHAEAMNSWTFARPISTLGDQPAMKTHRLSIALAALLALGVAGCAGLSWSQAVNGERMPEGGYGGPGNTSPEAQKHPRLPVPVRSTSPYGGPGETTPETAPMTGHATGIELPTAGRIGRA
jgi:hypothetical protein